jgi:hypothetical protein
VQAIGIFIQVLPNGHLNEMDPLSITASAITLAGALAKSLEQLRALQTASQDLLILINEISDFRIVLGEVERTILERRGYQHLPQTTLESMCTLLDRAKAKLLLLDKIVNDDLIRARLPSMEPKVARLGWLRQKPRIKELKESLKEIRLSLTALWGAASL